MIDYLKSPFFSPFCGPSVGQGQLSSLIISPSSLSLHTETLYLTSPVKFHTGLHLLSLICWGCLPCPARLWRPRFCAGQGTYSPYRHSVIFSRRESDSFQSFLDDGFSDFWMPAKCPAVIPVISIQKTPFQKSLIII